MGKKKSSRTAGQISLFWGESDKAYADAIRTAADEAKDKLGKNGNTPKWLEVVESRGRFDEDGDFFFQVAVRVGWV